MDKPNVNLMTETQRRLYKKIQERKALEEQKAKAEAEQAAAQQPKKKKKNRKKKKSGANAAAVAENGESPSPSQPSPNSENADPSAASQSSTASKRRRRKAAKKAAAASQSSEPSSSDTPSKDLSPSSPPDSTSIEKEKAAEDANASPTEEKQKVEEDSNASTAVEKEKAAEDSSASTALENEEAAEDTNVSLTDQKPKVAEDSNAPTSNNDAGEEKLDIDRSTFSEVQQRLKQLEDEALGRRPRLEVKGADNAPGWLGKEGNKKILAGSAANAKHHVVVGDDDEDMSGRDKAKMQALLGNAKATNMKSYVGLKGVEQTLTAEDYDNKMTVVFQSCRGCHFTLDSLCTKVFMTGCTDFTLTVNKKIVTQTMELFRCTNVTTHINVKARTVQADLSDNITLKFSSKENFDNIIWAGCEEMVTEFGDVADRMVTGWTNVQTEFADMHKERTQFKIHYVAGKLTQDKIIRQSDGFPTTKLAYDEYMRKQEAAIQHMAKNMGITISKKSKPKDERAGRNDPCPCGTGKKFKKCCGKIV